MTEFWMKNKVKNMKIEFNKKKKCVCGSTKLTTLTTIHLGKDKTNIVKCKKCGIMFLNPQLKDPGVLYEADYWTESPIVMNKEKTINNMLEKNPRYYNYLRILKKHKVKNILDVGAGTGDFAKLARSAKINVVCNELKKSTCDILEKKKFKTYLGDINDIKFNSQKFDAVTSIHVLEHVKDPIKDLRKIHSILKNDGLVIIATPNYASVFGKIAELPIIRRYTIDNDPITIKRRKNNVWHLSPRFENKDYSKKYIFNRFSTASLQHTFYFTPQSLTHLLRESGFKKIKFYTGRIDMINGPKTTIKKIILNGYVDDLLTPFGLQSELVAVAKK